MVVLKELSGLLIIFIIQMVFIKYLEQLVGMDHQKQD